MTTLSNADVEAIAAAVTARMKADGHTTDPAAVAAAAARTVVQEATVKGLAFVGINAADEKQLQALKEDLGFLRSFRLSMERMGRNIGSAITNAVVWGILVLLVIGFLFWSRAGGAPHPAPPPPLAR